MKKQTILTLLAIALVVAFFLTPLGFESKIFLKRLFLKDVKFNILKNPSKIPTYQWKLKDPKWNFFSFGKSKGKVVIVVFWNTWDVTCVSQLNGLQKLYDYYANQIDFYFITNELQKPVETFLKYRPYTFVPTYLIIEERAPLNTTPPGTYVIDKEGFVVVGKQGSYNWDTEEVKTMLNSLLAK